MSHGLLSQLMRCGSETRTRLSTPQKHLPAAAKARKLALVAQLPQQLQAVFLGFALWRKVNFCLSALKTAPYPE